MWGPARQVGAASTLGGFWPGRQGSLHLHEALKGDWRTTGGKDAKGSSGHPYPDACLCRRAHHPEWKGDDDCVPFLVYVLPAWRTPTQQSRAEGRERRAAGLEGGEKALRRSQADRTHVADGDTG